MDKESILQQLLEYSKLFDTCTLLLSNGFEDQFGQYEMLCGFGIKKQYNNANDINTEALKFGIISYDYKNRIENLTSDNQALFDVPNLFFYEPEKYFILYRNGHCETNINLDKIGNKIENNSAGKNKITWTIPDKKQYLKTVEQIKKDIVNGEYYEMNYCSQWSSENRMDFDPYFSFYRLNSISPAPFAGFMKSAGNFVLCSSPERFMKKSKNELISQPIKGTRRSSQDLAENLEIKSELIESKKDRAENIMITDLVRNDISRVCNPGTVQVPELCKVYSFRHVHQMISTIRGDLRSDAGFKEILHALFPMGSMTGAPKVRVMETIERYESFKRGWYSGSMGYLFKNTFDFNVIIRSILYNSSTGTLGYHAGGAITADSNPEEEYEECAAKAAAMKEVLGL